MGTIWVLGGHRRGSVTQALFGTDAGTGLAADDTSMVMSLKDMLDCIGCQACSRVCPKKCLSHEPAPVAA